MSRGTRAQRRLWLFVLPETVLLLVYIVADGILAVMIMRKMQTSMEWGFIPLPSSSVAQCRQCQVAENTVLFMYMLGFWALVCALSTLGIRFMKWRLTTQDVEKDQEFGRVFSGVLEKELPKQESLDACTPQSSGEQLAEHPSLTASDAEWLKWIMRTGGQQGGREFLGMALHGTESQRIAVDEAVRWHYGRQALVLRETSAVHDNLDSRVDLGQEHADLGRGHADVENDNHGTTQERDAQGLRGGMLRHGEEREEDGEGELDLEGADLEEEDLEEADLFSFCGPRRHSSPPSIQTRSDGGPDGHHMEPSASKPPQHRRTVSNASVWSLRSDSSFTTPRGTCHGMNSPTSNDNDSNNSAVDDEDSDTVLENLEDAIKYFATHTPERL